MPAAGTSPKASSTCYRSGSGRSANRQRRGPTLPDMSQEIPNAGRLIGLGVDLVELHRVERALGRWGGRFIEKLMDPTEAARLPAAGTARVHALACAIAGKEAASKAIGTGWSRGVQWRHVVVDPGPPASVQLVQRAAEVAARLGSDGSAVIELEERDGLILGRVALLGRP
jgi:holo-[acyl-carrier protein] synthase